MGENQWELNSIALQPTPAIINQVRHIKPGTPEFEAIAKSITPISRISSKQAKIYISAEEENATLSGRRRETVDALKKSF